MVAATLGINKGRGWEVGEEESKGEGERDEEGEREEGEKFADMEVIRRWWSDNPSFTSSLYKMRLMTSTKVKKCQVLRWK